MTMKLFLFLALAWPLYAADSGSNDIVTPLPQLADGAQWSPSDAKNLHVAGAGSALAVTFEPDTNTADLLLQHPIDIPENVNDFAYIFDGDPKYKVFDLDVIFQDGSGRLCYALAKVPGANAFQKSIGKIDADVLNGRPTRIATPGFAQPDNKELFHGFAGTPPRPWKLMGFRVSKDEKAPPAKAPLEFFLGNFAFTSELELRSEYSGVWGQTGRPINYGGVRSEFCAEMDGDHGIALSDYYQGPGAYQFSWDLYDQCAGVPMASGTQTLSVKTGSDAPPLALQLAQTVKFPREKPGTYWARWTAHYFSGGSPTGAPAKILSGEERVYVNTSTATAPNLTPKELAPGWVQIQPHGTSFISTSSADFVLSVQARRPDASATAGEVQIVVRTPHLHTEMKKLTVPLDFSKGDVAQGPVDLSSLPPGPYQVEADFLVNGQLYDRQVVLAGITNPGEALKPMTALPPGVLDWHQAVVRKQPYFHLSPMWHSATWFMTDHTRWDWFKNFLEQAPAVSHDVEYETPWSILEPLPGVYDWEEMDLFLSKAHELGEQVLVWPGFWGEEPTWLPAVPSQSRDGHIYYDFVYDFYGIRQDYANSPELQDALVNVLKAFSGHVRDNPAVEGYFLIQELPGDASFVNWYGGFGKNEKARYRAYLKENFHDEGTLSTRWGRTIQSFDAVEPPDAKSSDREWLDWLICRANAADLVMDKVLHAVRDTDSMRPIFVYGDVFGTSLKLSSLPALGCAKANGGSHDAMHPFPTSQIGQDGIMQRTEDHLPGKWTGYFPEMLDGSIFAMSYGGGLAMNCKAYVFTYLPQLGKDHFVKFDELRKPPYSLDKYEKFMPIWTAMRPTVRVPVQVIELLDTESSLLNGKELSRNGFWDGEAQLACYRAHINFAADEFPGAAKAKLLLMTKSGLESMTREHIEQLKAYVNGGGTLLMLAREGRKCVDEPASDWVLLHEFGFSPPTADAATKGNAKGNEIAGQNFGQGLGQFSVSGEWPHQLVSGETSVATGAHGSDSLLSWKSVGQGKVAVIWADELLPRGLGNPEGNVLKAAADWAGIDDVMGSDNSSFWLNMLKNPANGQYFGLVHAGQWQNKPDSPTSGKAWFKVDSGVTYHVTELITGKDLGNQPGDTIRSEGVQTDLTPRQTAVFQFDPVK